MPSNFVQRCIGCAAEFDLDARMYVCSRCGDLLDVERTEPVAEEPEKLRAVWLERLKSRDARDRSGVWRFREFLPFGEDVTVVSLGEGNTPLYDAPRSAEYC
ncbi:MAG TPA: hypothetical protein VLB87_10145, partial [Pyrinomonadaceae bacterium]|nr:hypothetical protein [Pyrinomonadaceae bacterium]